jgi:hypothetical protein
MRPTIAIRIIAPAVACLALVALPSAARAASFDRVPYTAPIADVSAGGLYSLTIHGGTKAEQRVDLMIVKEGDKYTGRLITAEQEVALESIVIDGDVVKAKVITNFGRATVTFRVEKDAVTGTMAVAKKNLAISGERVY